MTCQDINPTCTFKYLEAVSVWGQVPPPEQLKNVLGDATGEDDPMKKILGFTCTLGMGTSSSTLTIDLSGFHADAEDTVGRVAIFKCDEFGFGGVIKSVVHSENSNGQKTKIEMTDCKELLVRYDLFLNEWHDTTNSVSKSGGFVNINYRGWNCTNVHRAIEGDSWGDYIASNYGGKQVGINNYGTALPDAGQDCAKFGTSTDGKVSQGNTTYYKICQALTTLSIRWFNTKSYPLKIWIDAVRNIASEIPYVATSAKSMTLLDLINNVCEEAGYDWTFHTPDGNSIYMRFIDKKQEVAFGEVKNRILNAKNSGTNKLLNYSIGAEFKNEKTRRVVLGSKVNYIKELYFPSNNQSGGIENNGRAHKVAAVLGFTNDGKAIYATDSAGQPTTYAWDLNINTSTLNVALSTVGFPGFGTSTILGEIEMMATSNLATWKLFGILNPASISAKCMNHLGIDRATAFSKVSTAAADTHSQAQAAVEAVKFSTRKNVGELVYEEVCYSWIKNFYDRYYGKYYLCILPKKMCYNDPTGYMQANDIFLGPGSAAFMMDEPTDSGWGDFTNNTIGLNDWTRFKDNSGKTKCFCRIDGTDNLVRNVFNSQRSFFTDPSRIQSDFAVQGNYIYSDAEVDGRVFFVDDGTGNSSMGILVKLPNIIPQVWNDTSNKGLNSHGLRLLDLFSGSTSFINGASQYGGTTDFSYANVFKAADLAARIDAAAIPLKSKIVNYGPWLSHDRSSDWDDGGVELRHVEDLNPWTYGGYANMNTAGSKLATDGLKNRVRYESGSITIAETPQQNMEGGGTSKTDPVIASIVCKLDAGGATTTYNYQTYVQKFGQSAEAFNNYTKLQISNRRSNANILKDMNLEISRAFSSAMRSFGNIRERFFEQMSVPLSTSSSSLNNVLILSYPDTLTYPGRIEAGIDKKYTSDYFQDQNNYSKYAIVSLDMIFSPFSTTIGPGPAMPGFTAALGSSDYPANATKPRVPPTSSTQIIPIYNLSLNPYSTSAMMGNFNGAGSGRGFYTEYIAFGSVPANTFAANATQESFRDSQTNLRGAALRGPLVLHSWGYDTNGQPVPGSPTTFNSGWLGNPSSWPIGPIDLRWDRRRGVWVSPPSASLVVAELTSDLTIYSSASASIINVPNLYSTSINGSITVYDFIGQGISAGCRVLAYHFGPGADYMVVNAGMCLVKADAHGCEPSTNVGQPMIPQDKHLYGFGPNGRPAMYSIEELFSQPNLTGGSLKVLGYEELNDNGHPCMVDISVIDCSGNSLGGGGIIENEID